MFNHNGLCADPPILLQLIAVAAGRATSYWSGGAAYIGRDLDAEAE
jgi:hypothetical protein